MYLRRQPLGEIDSIFAPLHGAARGSRHACAERGYAMVALLVGLSVMAIMMTVAMPVWHHMAQREKEEELVFRGQQWARAVGLFQRKYANAAPPNLDVLVQERMIRRKYLDPMTGKEFVPILAGSALAAGGGQAAPGAQAPRQGLDQLNGGRGGQPQQPPAQQGQAGRNPQGVSPIGTPGAATTGGIVGVTSASKDKSIRLYNGRSHYNEWAFVYTAQVQQAGQGAAGTATPGQGTGGRGQPGRQNQPPGGGIGNRNPNPPSRGNPNPPGRGNPFGPSQSPFNPGQSPFGQPTPRGR